jgi:hypothetical protein
MGSIAMEMMIRLPIQAVRDAAGSISSVSLSGIKPE